MDNNETNSQQENKKNKLKKYLAIFCAFDLLVAIIFLMFLGIQKCSGPNNSGSTSSYNGPYDNAKLDSAFKYLVDKQLTVDGFNDNVDKVVSITYTDSYPNKFSLSITGTSNTKVYFYSITDYSYPESRDGYDNFVSFLLLNDNYKSLNPTVAIEQADIVDSSSFATTKANSNYVVGQNNNYYFSGYYFENNVYYVYNMKEVENGNDPFTVKENQRITSNDSLFGFYRSLDSNSN